MFLEVFVLGMCLGGYECDYSIRSYHLYDRPFQKVIQQKERQVYNMSGPVVKEYVLPYAIPVITILNDRGGTVKITKHVSFTIKQDSVKLTYQLEF